MYSTNDFAINIFEQLDTDCVKALYCSINRVCYVQY